MIPFRPEKLKPFSVFFVSLVLTFVMNSSSTIAVVPPCPAVSDVTIAQMAQQWAAMFKDPYCGFLQERSNILLRQKLTGGVFSSADRMAGIFKVLDEVPASMDAKTDVKNSVNIDFKNVGAREAALAKVRKLKIFASKAAYTAAKDSYGKSIQMEAFLHGFAPVAFDFVSKHQVQKDTMKLVHLVGLMQAQELKIISLLKMMHALEGEE